MHRDTTYILISCLFMFGLQTAQGGEPVPTQQALSMIRALEDNQRARITNAQWGVHSFKGKIPKAGEIDDLAPDPKDPKVYSKKRIIYEPGSGHYRVDEESVGKWVDGDNDYFASVQQFSFDGLTERWYRRGQGGTVLPPVKAPGFGTIKREKRNEFFDNHGLATGIAFFPPNHFGRRFSEFLQDKLDQKQPVEVTASDGLWVITTSPQQSVLVADSDFRVGYDPGRGLVLWGEWVSKPHVKSAWAGKAWKKHIVRWRQHSPGIWVPERFTQCNLIDGVGTRIDYSAVAVNQSVDEAVYRISFPVGTRLTDEVEKKSYTVTNGVIDEQEAIRQFVMEQAMIAGPDTGGWWGRWWLYVTGGVGLVVAGAMFVRFKRRWAAAASLLIACQAGQAAEPDAAGNWRVSHASGESYSISQCGLNVTLFALEYFQVGYDLKRVSVGLPPNEDGIRCLDIKSVLEGYGLEVLARDGVTLPELRRAIKPGVLAIFPVKLNDSRNHYLIATDHAQRGRIVLDPPNKITSLEDGLRPDQFASLGGLVLFVRRPKTPPPAQNSRVAVAPVESDLGVFRAGTPEYSKPVRKTLTITNASDRAVVVSSVVSPCGCLQVKWEGGVIGSGQQQEVPIAINPGGWGWGRVERTVTVVFSDGTQVEARLVASTPKPEEAQRLSVSPDIIRVDVPLDGNSGVIRRTASVTFWSGADTPKLTSRADWLTGRLAKTGANQGELTIEVDAARVPGPPYPVRGEIILSVIADQPPVVARVLVSRPVWYILDPAVVRCKRGEEVAVSLRPTPEGEVVLRGGKGVVTGKSPGVEVEQVEAVDGVVRLKVRCAATALPGYQEVRCRVGAANGGPSVLIPLYVD